MGQQPSKIEIGDGLSADELRLRENEDSERRGSTSRKTTEGPTGADANAASSSFGKLPSLALPKPFTKSDDEWNTRFLLGNLENLPASARKLFSMGKLYLTNEQGKQREAGYHNLFQPLPAASTENVQNHEGELLTDTEVGVNIGENDHTQRHDDTTINSSGQNQFLQQVKKVGNLFVPMQNTAPLNCTQTYVQWRAAHDLLSVYSFCLPTRNIIYIQPIDDFPAFLTTFTLVSSPIRLTFFEMLQGFVQIFFSGMEVSIQPPIFVSDEGWGVRSRLHESTNQKQYCVTDLYPFLQSAMPRDGRCVVGISWTDLYPEGFNFVLGEASHLHKAAVISFGRFETTNYQADSHSDITKVDGELVWKLLKTISHEVCHVFGFSHCTFFLCAMNESTSVSQALSQPLFLCPVCLRKLQRVCGFDILDRYRSLFKFLSNLDQQTGDCQRLSQAILWLSNCIDYLTSSVGG